MNGKQTNRTEILASAVSLARLLIINRPPEARDNHLKELLQILVWKATESDGKYNTRFVSEGFKQNPDTVPRAKRARKSKQRIVTG